MKQSRDYKTEVFYISKVREYISRLSIRNLTLSIQTQSCSHLNMSFKYLCFALDVHDLEGSSKELTQKIYSHQQFQLLKQFQTVEEFYLWVHKVYASMLLHESLELFVVDNTQLFSPHCQLNLKTSPVPISQLSYFQDNYSCSSQKIPEKTK